MNDATSFNPRRPNRVEVIDLKSDQAWDYTDRGLDAARYIVVIANISENEKRFAVMVDGGWDNNCRFNEHALN